MSAPSRTSTPKNAASKADLRVSLADLRASSGAFQVYEAAAIIQVLCRSIKESRDPVTKTALTLSMVSIDPEGSVSLSARPDPANALPHLKKLFFEMLAPGAVAQAKGLPESSLEEFSRALEAYERADRAGVIKDLRSRWRPSSSQAFDDMLKAEAAEKGESETKADASRRRMPRLLAVAAVAAVAIGAAIWVLGTPHLQAKIKTYAGAISLDSDANAASLTPPTSDKPTETPAEHTAPARPRPPKSGVAARPRADAEAPAASNRVATSRKPVASGVTRPTPATVSQPGLSATPTAPNAERVDAAVSTQVFDATEHDVVPPSFVFSGSTAPLATEASQQDAAAIEVIVNERGTIDAVKARRSPRTLAESMQMMNDLSAAKSWRFRPATRDGHPVKYRLVVPIAIR